MLKDFLNKFNFKFNFKSSTENYKNGKFDGLVEEFLQSEQVSTSKGLGSWVSPTSAENYKDGKCISSNIRNVENNGYVPCSRKDVDTATTIM
jgi:lysyl-tRNA synthetase class I